MRKSILLLSVFAWFGLAAGAHAELLTKPTVPPPMSAGVSCIDLGSSGGKLPDAVVQQCVNRHMGKLQAIYQRGLRTAPDTEGALVLALEVSPDGGVVASVPDNGTTLPMEMAMRMAHVFMDTKFPASSSGWKNQYTLRFYNK